MKTNHSSLTRGLYVAITVLAALSLVSCVIGVASMNILEKHVYDALDQGYHDAAYDYLYDMDPYLDDWYDGDGYWHDGEGRWYDGEHWRDDHDSSHSHHTALGLGPVRGYGYGSSSMSDLADSYAMADLAISFIHALLIWEIVVSVVSLLFGIIGLVNIGSPQKLSQLMGISIGGAVVSLLGGHIILMALFIIAAVMAHKDKTTLANANPAPTPSL